MRNICLLYIQLRFLKVCLSLLLLSSTSLYSQDFDALTEKASVAYDNKNYAASGKYYEQAFALSSNVENHYLLFFMLMISYLSGLCFDTNLLREFT